MVGIHFYPTDARGDMYRLRLPDSAVDISEEDVTILLGVIDGFSFWIDYSTGEIRDAIKSMIEMPHKTILGIYDQCRDAGIKTGVFREPFDKYVLLDEHGNTTLVPRPEYQF